MGFSSYYLFEKDVSQRKLFSYIPVLYVQVFFVGLFNHIHGPLLWGSLHTI